MLGKKKTEQLEETKHRILEKLRLEEIQQQEEQKQQSASGSPTPNPLKTSSHVRAGSHVPNSPKTKQGFQKGKQLVHMNSTSKLVIGSKPHSSMRNSASSSQSNHTAPSSASAPSLSPTPSPVPLASSTSSSSPSVPNTVKKTTSTNFPEKKTSPAPSTPSTTPSLDGFPPHRRRSNSMNDLPTAHV